VYINVQVIISITQFFIDNSLGPLATESPCRIKYMVMSRDQNAGRIHSVRIDNSTFERVEQLRYLGITLPYQNSILEEIKSKLKSGNACCHSVQNLLSSSLLSKNLKIKIYRTIISAVFVWV